MMKTAPAEAFELKAAGLGQAGEATISRGRLELAAWAWNRA